MAHPSLSFSNPTASPGVDSHIPANAGAAETGKSGSNDDLQRAIDTLRAESGWTIEQWLQRVAEIAQRVTAANGAAIAMRQDSEIVCRARAGEMAPPLGTKLDANSGISGECLSTARPVRCEDTTRDARVDPEVRRQLGLWSLAAVPLGQESNVIGILEVFSALPYSFSLRHVEMLQQLADLVIAAQGGATGALAPGERERNLLLGGVTAQARPEPTLGLRERIANFLDDERAVLLHAFQTQSGRRRLAVTTMAALAISLGLGWFFGQAEPTKSSPPRTSDAPARHVRSASSNASTALVWGPQTKPASAGNNVKPNPSSIVVMAGKRENVNTEDVVGRPEPQGNAVHMVVMERKPLSVIPATDSGSAAENAPALAAVGSGTQDPLGTVLSAPLNLPEAAMAVSKGVTQGVLVQHVQPAYPMQARAMRLEGSVVLQALVLADGRVQQVHVISGHPLLAGAARSAVAHWRYRPFLLNGTPVPMRTQIQVDFKLPTE